MDNMFSTPERKLTFPEEKVKEGFGNTNIGEVMEEDEEYSSVAESDTDMKVESFSDDGPAGRQRSCVIISYVSGQAKPMYTTPQISKLQPSCKALCKDSPVKASVGYQEEPYGVKT